MMSTQGFFVDWDGNTRRVESPGPGLVCQVVQREGYLGVDVCESDGMVCHEAVYYADLDELRAAGVTVNLVEESRQGLPVNVRA